jgi:hypothetical protein
VQRNPEISFITHIAHSNYLPIKKNGRKAEKEYVNLRRKIMIEVKSPKPSLLKKLRTESGLTQNTTQ